MTTCDLAAALDVHEDVGREQRVRVPGLHRLLVHAGTVEEARVVEGSRGEGRDVRVHPILDTVEWISTIRRRCVERDLPEEIDGSCSSTLHDANEEGSLVPCGSGSSRDDSRWELEWICAKYNVKGRRGEDRR